MHQYLVPFILFCVLSEMLILGVAALRSLSFTILWGLHLLSAYWRDCRAHHCLCDVLPETFIESTEVTSVDCNAAHRSLSVPQRLSAVHSRTISHMPPQGHSSLHKYSKFHLATAKFLSKIEPFQSPCGKAIYHSISGSGNS